MPRMSTYPLSSPVTGDETVLGLKPSGSSSDDETVLMTVDDIASYVLAQDSNSGGGGNAFGTISVSGQSDVVAEQPNDTLTLVAGSNITLTTSAGGDSVTIAASGGSGGSDWRIVFKPRDNEPPSSNYATLDTRNGHPVLDFDTTTQEAAIFTGILPADYAGGGITVGVICALTSATSGTVGWDVAIERIDASSLDIDSDSFASAQTITAVTVPGTSGQVLYMSVNISNGANMDSLAAGEMFRLRVRRDVANDTATGDAELLGVTIVEQ